jgi:hypothetical protein
LHGRTVFAVLENTSRVFGVERGETVRPREAYKKLNEAVRKRLPEEVLLRRHQEFAAAMINFFAEGGGRVVSARSPSGAEVFWVQKGGALVGFLPAGFLPEFAADVPSFMPPEAELDPEGFYAVHVLGMDEDPSDLLPYALPLLRHGFLAYFWLRRGKLFRRYACVTPEGRRLL